MRPSRLLPRALLLGALVSSLPGVVLASPGAASPGPTAAATPAATAPDGLRPAPAPTTPPRSEGFPAPEAVTAGFMALWALLLGLVVHLASRDRRLEQELDALEQRLEGPSPAPKGDAP